MEKMTKRNECQGDTGGLSCYFIKTIITCKLTVVGSCVTGLLVGGADGFFVVGTPVGSFAWTRYEQEKQMIRVRERDVSLIANIIYHHHGQNSL